jgi:uncharacterized protein (DUF1800 family)
MAAITLDTSTDPHVGFRPPGELDVATALQAYSGHFGERHAAHLLRRAGFGGTNAEVGRLAGLSADAAVDWLMHPSTPDLTFPDYPSMDELYAEKKYHARIQTELWWLDRMLRTQHPLTEKMTLFWHGHFATSIAKVPAPLMARQIDVFREKGMGNFRTLLAAVSVDPAMTVWLDNRANAKLHPNENYAREVMELFTLGLGNYTEDDVKEGARALTGWTYNGKTMTVAFDPRRHDDGIKTFLGRTGSFGLDDVVDILVAQPVHQRFIARKLLEFFVYSDPEPELTEAVAQVYGLSGFDIAKTVGTILRSNVFFSQRAYRALPKSPIEFTIGLLRYSGATSVPPKLPDALRRMGQEPLAPPNVKGWDGGPTWINTSTLLTRFNFVNALVSTGAGAGTGTTRRQATARTDTATQTSATQTGATMQGAAAMPAATAMLPVTSMQPRAAMAAGMQPASAMSDTPNISPDAIVAQAGGMDPARIVSTIVSNALQDDVTSDIRTTLLAFLTSSGDVPTAGGAAAGTMPFGPENYQEKVRGALALALNLPVNQLN